MEGVLESRVENMLKAFDTKAVIFDLDGTLLDNNSYHLKSWLQYLKNIGRTISEEEYNEKINGRTNKDVIRYIYGNSLTEEEILQYTLEKEALYRDLYKPHIKPVAGLIDFLEVLKKKHIPMAIATSGIQPNIDFMFDEVPIRSYFKEVVNSAHILKGKPDPEIYLKTASLLDVSPGNCLVFEDAVVGVKSAKAAGMKVVAVATTHPRDELSMADMVIGDYKF